jgi:hypothetical protein
LFSPLFNAVQPNSGSDFNQLQQRLQEVHGTNRGAIAKIKASSGWESYGK